MRIRQKNIVITSVSAAAFTDTAITSPCQGPTTATPAAVTAYGPISTYVEQGKIADSLGKGNPHPVTHRSVKYRLGDNFSAYRYGRTVYPFGMETLVGSSQRWVLPFRDAMNQIHKDDWYLSLPGRQSELPPRWTVQLSPVDEGKLIEDCFEKAKNLKADVLLNLVEANQMWPAVKSLTTCLPEMATNWKSIRKVLRTASGGYLAWKFGISPIISDLSSIAKHSKVLSEDLKRHVDQEKFRYSAFAEHKLLFDNSKFVHTSANGFDTRVSYPNGQFYKPPILRYVLVVKPKIKYSTSLFQGLDYLMSRFSSSPASLAWEKVPFSFVVDWFVDLRGVLRKLDQAVGFEPYDIVAFTRSYSYSLRSSVNIVTKETCAGADLDSKFAGSIEFKHYERTLASPSPTWASWRPRFGKNQAGVSAALIAQQLTKLRARR